MLGIGGAKFVKSVKERKLRKMMIKLLVTRLEFWNGNGSTMLLPPVFVPAGYSIPRIGEMVVLPSGSDLQARVCKGIIHQFNSATESQVAEEDCALFTIRVILSDPQQS